MRSPERLWQRLFPALLFLTLSAYLGAALWSALQRPLHSAAAEADPAQLTLEGIALRRERPVQAELAAGDGARLPAGTALGAGESAPSSVLYFSDCDGLEGLSPEDAADWDVPALRQKLESAVAAFSPDSGRVVEGFDWAWAALCPAGAAPEAGARCRLRFDGREESVSARVLSVSPPQDGLCAVLFRLTAGDDFYWKLRLCRAELLS